MSDSESNLFVERLFKNAYKFNPNLRNHLAEFALEMGQFSTIGTHPIVCIFLIFSCFMNVPLELISAIPVVAAAIGIPYCSLNLGVVENPLTLYIETIMIYLVLRGSTILGVRWFGDYCWSFMRY